jgi:hypothetical protein
MDVTSSAHTKTADKRTMNSKPEAEALNGKKSRIGFGKMKYLISENAHRRPYAYKWSLNSKYWYNLTSGDNISPSRIPINTTGLKGLYLPGLNKKAFCFSDC